MAATKNLIAYAASTTPAMTLAALASDTNLLAGRSSVAWDNTANLYLDLLVSGFVVTGTSPTAGAVYLYAVGMVDDATWPDNFDGTDKNVSITTAAIRDAVCVPVWSAITDATSNRVYPIRLTSLASLFGGSLPAKGQLWVVHNTAAALKSSGQEISLKGVYTTSGN